MFQLPVLKKKDIKLEESEKIISFLVSQVNNQSLIKNILTDFQNAHKLNPQDKKQADIPLLLQLINFITTNEPLVVKEKFSQRELFALIAKNFKIQDLDDSFKFLFLESPIKEAHLFKFFLKDLFQFIRENEGEDHLNNLINSTLPDSLIKEFVQGGTELAPNLDITKLTKDFSLLCFSLYHQVSNQFGEKTAQTIIVKNYQKVKGTYGTEYAKLCLEILPHEVLQEEKVIFLSKEQLLAKVKAATEVEIEKRTLAENLAREVTEKIQVIERQNQELEKTKIATLNLLEDEKTLEVQLEKEKASVEQKVIEKTQELVDEKGLLFKFLETIPFGVFVLSASGNPYYANSHARELLGNAIIETASDSLSKVHKAYISTTDVLYPKEKLPIFQALSGITSSVSDMEILNNDKRITVEVTGSPIKDHDGKVLYAIATYTDITERKIAERSKDEFFSIASHELRTPLTSIRGNTSMILDYFKEAIKDKDLHEMIDDIHESSIRLISIVNDFLDLSRLEQGKISFQNDYFSIAQIIEKVCEETKNIALPKNLYIKFEKPVANMPPVYADKNRVIQVVTNLIGNSIKYTDNGGVTIRVNILDNDLEVEIKDTGRGIPAQNQDLLFRKFQQASSSLLTRDTVKSTGLGLFISKLLIENMNGKIYLKSSAENQGSTFAFTLPLNPISTKAPQPVIASRTKTSIMK